LIAVKDWAKPPSDHVDPYQCSRSSVFRSKFTLSWRALARALVMGPCGGLGGLEAEVSKGHPVSMGEQQW
jgi:hypothetical protein